MLAASMIAIFFIPVFFILVEKISGRDKHVGVIRTQSDIPDEK
jgi:hypothetical protein